VEAAEAAQAAVEAAVEVAEAAVEAAETAQAAVLARHHRCSRPEASRCG